jgi:ribonucleoside-diphosphate reductase alpha chain
MCPDKCPGLSDTYGDDFVELYTKYENEGRYTEQIPAIDLWFKIIESQIETGTPYMLYKDAVNRKNNQSNLGVIKSSNLCCEIVEYTSPDEVAVCNLASLCLPSFLKIDLESNEYSFDFNELGKATEILTKNLNKIIDKNFYPLDSARKSNLRHRPIAIGVQGLSDTFVQMRYPYESEEAQELNKNIFECIYYHALKSSMNLARKLQTGREQGIYPCNEYDPPFDSRYPGAYSTFEGSPLSEGIFQFDMWGVCPSTRYDWKELKSDILRYGVRNSMLVGPMPTASTAQIMGNTESFEVPTSNIYTRMTMAGNYIVLNKYMVRDLMKLGLWNKDMKNQIIENDGMISNISSIPEDIRALYKTAWEISQRIYINMAKDRGAYICQSQSMNLFISNPTTKLMNTVHFHAWESGLKTGMYYLRTKPKASAQRFSMKVKNDPGMCRKDSLECEACSA